MRAGNREITLDRIQGVEVYQRKRGYRFGVEAPLLAAFVGQKRFERAAELGTGVGIVAILIAAERRRGLIDAVEIQAGLAQLARLNVGRNGFENRIRIIRGDARMVRELLPLNSYDLVFGNPPFRRTSSGRTSISTEKEIARGESFLSLRNWVDAASALLRNRGRCCLVHDAGRLPDVLSLLRGMAIEPKRLRFVHHDGAHVASLVLVEAIKAGRPGILVDAPVFLADIQRELPAAGITRS